MKRLKLHLILKLTIISSIAALTFSLMNVLISPTKSTISQEDVLDLIQKEKIKSMTEPTNRTPASEDFIFKYRYKGDELKLTLKNMSWEKAHKESTTKCMDYYKDKNPSVFEKAVKGDEDEYLSMIDVCANPREGNKAISYDNWND